MNVYGSACVPQVLEAVNDQRQPCRFDHRHCNRPECAELACAVNTCTLKHGIRHVGIHKVFHQVKPQRCAERGNDDRPVGIYPVEDTHNNETGNSGNGGVEHQRGTHQLEHPLVTGEFDLRHGVCAHGGAEQMSHSTGY